MKSFSGRRNGSVGGEWNVDPKTPIANHLQMMKHRVSGVEVNLPYESAVAIAKSEAPKMKAIAPTTVRLSGYPPGGSG